MARVDQLRGPIVNKDTQRPTKTFHDLLATFLASEDLEKTQAIKDIKARLDALENP